MKNPVFVKTPAFFAVAASVVLVAAGVGFSAGKTGASFPAAYTPSLPPVVSIASERMESLPDLKSLDKAFQRLAEFAAPGVVAIKTEGSSKYSMLGQKEVVSGEGSGVILRPDGWIVTNDHVVAGFDKVTVVLHDGREFQGTVRRAPENDIAVVKIDAKDLPTLQFGDSSQVRVGQLAMAVGAPFGLENTVTYGHVSAIGRPNAIPDQHAGIVRRYYDLIQADTPINMGNSGGPLIDSDGQVIGINSAIFSLTGGSNGIGFAISSNMARTLAETLIEKGKVVRSYAGVAPQTLKEFEKKQLKLSSGAILREVPSNGPAAAAGIKQNDVVVRVGTLPILTEADLRNAMYRYAPGATVPFEVVRDGQHKIFEVKLAEVPKDTAPAMPGEGSLTTPQAPNMPDIRQFIPREGNPDDNAAPKQGNAHLGVQVQNLTDDLRKQYHVPASEDGALVVMVEPDSVASRLGLTAGDVIQSVGNKRIKAAGDVVAAMQSVKWGDQTSIAYARFGAGSVTTRAKLDVTFR